MRVFSADARGRPEKKITFNTNAIRRSLPEVGGAPATPAANWPTMALPPLQSHRPQCRSSSPLMPNSIPPAPAACLPRTAWWKRRSSCLWGPWPTSRACLRTCWKIWASKSCSATPTTSLRPGVEQVRKLGGLHRFMSWPRAILTDTGGYQVFSLSDLRKVSEEGVAFRSHLDGSSHFLSPETAIAAQINLGADIIMAFDECTEHPAERQRARASMELTLRWAERSKRYFEEHKREVPWAGTEGR